MEAHRLVADFINASAQLENYLQVDGPRTSVQVDSLTLTISGLQTLMDNWKRKNWLGD